MATARAAARRRLAAGQRARPDLGFGVAAECGFGRMDAGDVARFLDLHRDAAGI